MNITTLAKNLSDDQKTALDTLLQWAKRPPSPFITLGGYAGTGKSSLIAVLRDRLHKEDPKLKVAFCSYTGKATQVLKEKLKEGKALQKGDSVSTIHSLIYSPIVNSDEEIVGWEKLEKLEYDLIVVDEASMIDQYIWSDLSSYGIPIIAVGDHGQLPPIHGEFNLVKTPVITLNQIHRQAQDNPIIKLSMIVRNEGRLPVGDFGDGVRKLKRVNDQSGEVVTDILQNYTEDTMILCGYNRTRVKLNTQVRQYKEMFSPFPEPGDRVICLRNNHSEGIFNGMLGVLDSLESSGDDLYLADISMDGKKSPYKGLIYSGQFGSEKPLNYSDVRRAIGKADLFDFGYALTVHKSQGSQAEKVLLIEERFRQMEDDMWSRWLYTAVTRAERELTVIGS